MHLTMASTAKMGDRIVLLDATRTNNTNAWIINPNGLSINTPGLGTGTWTVNTQGIQYELIYFESTRNGNLSGWIIRETTP